MSVFAADVDAQLRTEAIKVRSGDAQDFGSTAPASVGLRQRVPDACSPELMHLVSQSAWGVVLVPFLRQVLGQNEVAGSQRDSSLDDVLQFPHISGPAVVQQHLFRF